jgi:hypothetical protein
VPGRYRHNPFSLDGALPLQQDGEFKETFDKTVIARFCLLSKQCLEGSALLPSWERMKAVRP